MDDGATGLIGSHKGKAACTNARRLVRWRQRTSGGRSTIHRLQALTADLKNLPEVIEGDIAEQATVEKAFTEHNFDKVVHLAAGAAVQTSIERPQISARANVDAQRLSSDSLAPAIARGSSHRSCQCNQTVGNGRTRGRTPAVGLEPMAQCEACDGRSPAHR